MWDAANAYCQGLSWGGNQGYRLPTLAELTSLTRYDQPAPALDPDAFPGVGGDFWTGTANLAFTDRKFVVSYGDGRTLAKVLTDTAGAWCVRDLKPAPDPGCVRYVFEDDAQSVRDVETGLVWQRTQDRGQPFWDDAGDACKALGPAWRLPQVAELLSLFDATGGLSSGLDAAFFPSSEPGTYYWTATPDAIGGTTAAWNVQMSSCRASPGLTMQSFYVRCVR